MEIIAVDPARVEHSHWNDRTQSREGGDIALAYSADRIGEGSPIRKPFAWQGQLMVTVSGGPGPTYEAYRLVPVKAFDGIPTTYAEKVCRDGDCGEVACNDPLGFYHGMTVKSGRETYVIVGPEVRFVADPKLAKEQPAEQLNLL